MSGASGRLAGTVNRRGDALVEVEVVGPRGVARLSCVVDTGFTGTLVLPRDAVRALGLRYRGSTAATLADGSEVVFSRFEAEVSWLTGRRAVRALAAAGATALIGAGLLAPYRLVIDYGERVVEIS